MRRAIKTFLSFAVAFSLCLGIYSFNALAANASIAFSKQNASVGDTITVTITLSAPDMYGVNVVGNYNEQVLTYISGASSGGAGLFQIADSESFNGESSKSFKVTFKAKSAGSSSVSISGQVASGIPPADVSVSASATLNVSDVSKSNNANLSSLRTGVGTLSPKFSPNVTEYTVNVKNSDTKCLVYGVTADKDATFVVNGSADLKVGTNTRVIVVTAPSGAQKSYTLTIIRSDQPDEETSSTTAAPSALEVVMDGMSYAVLKDISGLELPVGFNITKRLYNNEEVSVAIDEKGNYELFYLKRVDGEETAPYTYDETRNAFTKVHIITQGSNSYIVAEIPDDLSIPEGYTAKTVKIQDMSIGAYISDDEVLKDMYYIYCYFGGNYSMYRYDSAENVLQRCPEFELSSKNKSTSVSNIEFFNRFNKLSSNGKTIVVCLCIAFLGVVALLILTVIKLIKRGQFADFDLENEEIDEFDSITFNDDYKITPNETEEDE